MILEVLKSDEVKELLVTNDVARLGLFGSCARGEQGDDSDVDLLVSFNKRKGLFAFVQLERKLGAALGRKVDLVTENSVSPHFKDSILRESITIYGN